MCAERGSAMARMTNAQLQERLEAAEARLHQERARADAAEAAAEAERARAEEAAAELARAAEEAERAAHEAAEARAAASAGAVAAALPGDELPASGRRRRGAGRAILSATCIVLAALLSPVALVASWSGALLTDTDRFVAMTAPLLKDPQVQEFVADRATEAIVREADIEGIVSAAFGGLSSAIGLPGPASRALGLLEGAAVEAVEALIDQAVRTVLTSDAFASVGEQALRASHAQLIATLRGDPSALVRLGDDGVLSLPLGPIVAEVRAHLLGQGVSLAGLIPDIDTSIELVQSDALPAVRLAYGVAVASSIALPIACLVLFAVGVLVARNRPRALVGAGIGLGIAMAAVAGSLAAVGGAIALIVPVSAVPESVSGILYWAVASGVRDLAVALLVLAVAVALVAWYAGRSTTATRLRGAADGALGAVRGFADAHGLGTGRVGAALHRQRWLVRAAIAVGAGLVIVLVRPLTAGLVLGALAVALLVLLVAELVRRPAAPADAAPPLPVPLPAETP